MLLTFFLLILLFISLWCIFVCPCPSCSAAEQKWNYRWFFGKVDWEFWWILEKPWTVNSPVSELLWCPLYSVSQGNVVNNRNSINHHFPTFLICRNHFPLLSGLIDKETQNTSRNTEHHDVTESTKWSIYIEFIIMVSEHLLYLKWENNLNAVFSQKILHKSRNYYRLI